MHVVLIAFTHLGFSSCQIHSSLFLPIPPFPLHPPPPSLPRSNKKKSLWRIAYTTNTKAKHTERQKIRERENTWLSPATSQSNFYIHLLSTSRLGLFSRHTYIHIITILLHIWYNPNCTQTGVILQIPCRWCRAFPFRKTLGGNISLQEKLTTQTRKGERLCLVQGRQRS